MTVSVPAFVILPKDPKEPANVTDEPDARLSSRTASTFDPLLAENVPVLSLFVIVPPEMETGAPEALRMPATLNVELLMLIVPTFETVPP